MHVATPQGSLWFGEHEGGSRSIRSHDAKVTKYETNKLKPHIRFGELEAEAT